MTTLQEYIDSGRLIRNQWTGTDAQGRATACLLAALSPDVARQHSAHACPASIMPPWLARLTPWMDDSGTEEAWPAMVQRYADLAARWHVLTPDDWIRLDYTARRIAVESMLPYAGQASDVVRQVIDLLRRTETGDTPTPDEFRAAAHAAAHAADAADAAAYAAYAIYAAHAAYATHAVHAAAYAAARAAARAAAYAADAADAAAYAAARAAFAVQAARAAADATAADVITSSIFDAIEARIVAREQPPCP